MLTKQDFVDAAFSNISDYPALEALYQAKDPRLFQHIEAIATMLSMFSSQVEVAQAEPFEKTRDSTVLADAAMRGIIPKATPTILNINVENTSISKFSLSMGRVLLDSNGRYLRVNNAFEIEGGSTATVSVSQLYSIQIEHVVAESKPFYAIPLDMENDESMLCGVRVFNSSGTEFEYTQRYSTVKANENVFHIEVDERRKFYIRFGYKGVVGVQPAKGDKITIQAFYSLGRIDNYKKGDAVLFETTQTILDANIKMTVDEVISQGENPISISTLRELAKYPSVYNENAVYLGEFDSLVRSNISDLAFLSVWNEASEELARGSDYRNINSLFVAVVGGSGEEEYTQFNEDEAPIEVVESELTALQQRIKKIILRADDSYKVRFYKPRYRQISVSVKAKISTSYDSNIVSKQIQTAILEKYGQNSVAMSRGKAKPSYQEMYAHIKKNVSALSVGSADLQINFEDLSAYDKYPEIWQYIESSSLSIVVTAENVSTNSWGVGF